MGVIWIKEMTGGLDTRRLPETTPGGVLIRARDGHITRGGEFEKRAAFVPSFALPAGTVGLAHTRSGLVVFGHAAAPLLPTGVAYQRLQHPSGSVALVNVPSYDLYDGKIYAVGEFADGSTYHFYDGARVTDWYDGRARLAFRVLGGTGSSELSNLTVDGVAIIGSPVTWATSNPATATAIADEINTYTSVPEYVATAIGDEVVILAATSGAAPNGRLVAATVASGLLLSLTTPSPLAGGGTEGGTQPSASFRITGGGAGGSVASVTVSGVSIMAGAVNWAGSVAATATAVATSINTAASSPDYTATAAADGTVTITAAARTDAINGVLPVVTTSGNLTLNIGTVAASTSFTITGDGAGAIVVGGSPGTLQPVSATIRPFVSDIAVTNAPVAWVSSAASTATAVAAAINAHTSSPNYTAIAIGATVTVTAAVAGAAANGRTIGFAIVQQPTFRQNGTTSGGFPQYQNFGPTTLGASPSGAFSGGVTGSEFITAFTGGAADNTFTPGAFVRTIKSKMYATAGSLLHYSGIQAPTQWTTDVPGAGFVNMATQNSGSERLTAVARYQNLLAIFSPEVVQIWFVDADPNLNNQSQVLDNTGTECPKSVTRFGDSDVFYLDESGVRSLRARDSSNAAATTDIGVPIDDLLVAKLAGLTAADRLRVVGLINPVDKRFWLIIKDEVFVFSFYENAKVSAWSTYTLSTTVNGVRTAFEAEYAIAANRGVFVRSGNTIYSYGGTAAAPVFDGTEAEVWLPYLDANRPTAHKDWEGIDVALTGLWELRAATQPTDLNAAQVIARAYQTTYNMHRVAYNHTSSHLSLRAISKGEGRAVLSALAIHFRGGEDET